MTKTEFTYPSSDHQSTIHGILWLPEKPPIAVLQIAHGVSEYIGRYEPFAIWLTKRGFAVLGNDHLGHGRTVTPDAPPLYFGSKGSWDYVVDDIYALRERAGAQFPDIPYFLMGHSMGSFLVRTYLIRYPGTVDGAIIMGTGHVTGFRLQGGRLLVAIESIRQGETGYSPLVNRLAFGTYNKKFIPNRTNHDWLSVNAANVDAYVSDPHCGGDATLGLVRELLSGMAFITNPNQLDRMDNNTPILFISGGMDPVGDFGKGVNLAVHSFQDAGVRDVTLKLYPNLRHEILNEEEKEIVYEDIYRWLRAHIAQVTVPL